jgi:hypothetical protein
VRLFSGLVEKFLSPAHSYSPYPLNPLLRGTAESSRTFRVSYVNFFFCFLKANRARVILNHRRHRHHQSQSLSSWRERTGFL